MELKSLKTNKLLTWFWIIIAGGILFVSLLFISISNGLLGAMPTFDELENPKSNLATEIISSDQQVLGSFYRENRNFSSFEELSPNIVNALVATEDVRFYEHSGIDTRGLLRVFFKTVILQNESAGGGSTISQQLAKLLFHDSAANINERILQKLSYNFV